MATETKENTATVRYRISASALGLYFKDNCQLHLQLKAEGKELPLPISLTPPAGDDVAHDVKPRVSALSDAIMQRGNVWEDSIVAMLAATRTVRKLDAGKMDALHVLRGIRYCEKSTLIVYHLRTMTPVFEGSCFQQCTAASHAVNPDISVQFSSFEPDFLVFKDAIFDPAAAEPTAVRNPIVMHIIDAKSSSHLKISHQIQVAYYALAIRAILQHEALDRRIVISPVAAIWQPKTATTSTAASLQKDHIVTLPNISEIKFDVSLVETVLQQFLASQLPLLLSTPRSEADWHYNPACIGCEYETACEQRALREGTLSVIPDLSHGDRKWLQGVVAAHGVRAASATTEIEDLNTLVEKYSKSSAADRSFSKSVRQKLFQLCNVRESADGAYTSSVLSAANNAVRHHKNPATKLSVQFRDKTCTEVPKCEDVAFIVDFAVDYLSGEPYAWVLSAVRNYKSIHSDTATKSTDGANITQQQGKVNPIDEPYACSTLLLVLAAALSDLEDGQSVQVYVPDEQRLRMFRQLIFNCSLLDDYLYPKESHAAEICVKAFIDSADGILSPEQPTMLEPPTASPAVARGTPKRPTAGAGSPGRPISDPLEKPTAGSPATPAAGTVGKPTAGAGTPATPATDGPVKPSGGTWAASSSRYVGAYSPRIAVISRFLLQAFDFPISGYVDATECGRYILHETAITDEMLFQSVTEDVRAQDTSKDEAPYAKLSAALALRASYWHRLLTSAREMIGSRSAELFPFMPAPMDLKASTIKNPILRKVRFIRDLESSSAMTEIQLGRLTGKSCITLELGTSVRGLEKNTVSSDSVVISAPVKVIEADKDKELSLHKWLLYYDKKDSAGNTALTFRDINYMNKTDTFRYKSHSTFFLVGVSRIDTAADGSMERVVVEFDPKTPDEFLPRAGSRMVLCPRFTDFTTLKLFNFIAAEDLQPDPAWILDVEKFGAAFNAMPEDMFLGPNHKVGHKQLAATMSTIRLAREIDVLGKELRFKDSQNTVFRQLLDHRIFVVWGPPGTGKTHFLALTMLLMLSTAYKVSNGEGSFKILVTAATHPAIDNLLNRVITLLQTFKLLRHEEMGAWKTDMKVFKYDKAHATDLGDPALAAGTDTPPKITVGAAKSFPFQISGATVWKTNDKLAGHKFDLVVVEEASQLQAAEGLIPARCLGPRGRLVVCGDHLQLGPIMQNEFPSVPDMPPLHGSMLDITLHQLTSHTLAGSSRGTDPDDPLAVEVGVFDPLALPVTGVGKLRHNYRMNTQLTQFTRRVYGQEYEESSPPGLITVDEPLWKSALAHTGPLSNLSDWAEGSKSEWRLPALLSLVVHGEVSGRSSESGAAAFAPEEAFVLAEADLVSNLVLGLYQAGNWKECGKTRIFVVAPHRAQRECINKATKRKLKDAGMDDLSSLDVADTVERRQGAEADVVIVCYGYFNAARVAEEAEFVYNRARLNVAITRARRCCVLVTTSAVLAEVSKANSPSECAAVLDKISDSADRNDCLLHLRAFVAGSTRLDVDLRINTAPNDLEI